MIEKISLQENTTVSFYVLENFKYLCIKNTGAQSKFFILPSTVSCKINNSFLFLVTKEKKNASFNTLYMNVFFVLKTINVIFKTKMFLRGLGFRLEYVDTENILKLKLGYSHLVYFKLPLKNFSVKIKKKKLRLECVDKVLLGNTVNKICLLKHFDAYKGKGFLIKYSKVFLKPVKKTNK